MHHTRTNCLLRAVVFLLLVAVCSGGVAQEPPPVLTHALDVISLPAERASVGLKAFVTGVVTAADPALDGRFFVQDATAGVFVDNGGGQRPEPGDLVEVSGITHAGAYAPIITAPQVKKIGTGPLPAAKRIPIERLMSGAEDSQRVEVSGLLRAARFDGVRWAVDIVSGGYRFRAYAPASAVKDPQSLVGAQVRTLGTAAEAHNSSLRQLIAVDLYIPTAADFIVEIPESSDPFQQTVVPLDSLAQYRRENSLTERVHVKGAVTLQRAGQNLFLQDPSGGLQVKSSEQSLFKPGDVIEAVGFRGFEDFLPVLEDAVFRPTQDPKVPIVPKPATMQELQNGLHHAAFISIRTKLMDRTVREGVLHPGNADQQELITPSGRSTEGSPVKTTLMLQADNFIFGAEADGAESKRVLGAIPIGSTLEVKGVCLKDIERGGRMISFRLLIGNPADVVIVSQPSWLTPQRLLAGLAALSLALVIIMSWTVMVSRKNSVLKFLIGEREKAQLELQQAHDSLERRVKERTEQLKFEVTARKEAEVQFKAVLSERTRLAQELHDTLEQTLTGIGLQLDTAAKLFQQEPERAGHHLKVSRNLMRQSQVELRRSVWDLRSRALEEFDLAEALRRSGRQMVEGTGMHLGVQSSGKPKPLPEVVEENLLRIGQEALTNIVKHSGATEARILLDFDSDKFALEITDNGRGFAPESCARAPDGHFGLLGMTERAKRMGGQVVISSAPGKGTTVRVEVPVAEISGLHANGDTSVNGD